MSPSLLRVMVVDDHSLFRRGLTALLSHFEDLTLVGEAADGGEALRRIAELSPDVVLLDQHLPGVSGSALLPGLRQAAPAARFLMLTVSEDEQHLAEALRAGAAGYLLKTVDADDLARAIRDVAAGRSALSPDMTPRLMNAFRASVPAPSPRSADSAEEAGLSPREQDILREIARGASNKEIGRVLGIAETTVKIHVQHILRKLGLSSRVQIAVWATSEASRT